MTYVTKDQIAALQADLLAAIAPVLAQHQMAVTGTKGLYGEKAGINLVLAPIVDGVVESAERVMFRKYARTCGLPEDALGRAVTVGGKAFTIQGLTSTLKVALADSRGKHYSSPVAIVQKALVAA